MTQNTAAYKKRLEKELKLLKTELATVGRVNPDNPKDWEATPPPIEITKAENEEIAERIEQYEGNTAILKELEIQFNDVQNALKRIEDGTYGKCEICGKEIEEDRLEAEPSAKTCIAHIEK